MSCPVLAHARPSPYVSPWRDPSVIVAVIVSACLAGPALAATTGPGRPPPPQQHPKQRTDDPKPLGKFDSWVAATHLEGGQTVCYAFTRAQNSAPKLPGPGDARLPVTYRPTRHTP